MKAEIISIGTELLLGRTINSDAAILARQLAQLGFDLQHLQTVGDNAERLAEALELAKTRSDIIFTTGGLGLTDDDLTKATVARIAGVELVEYPEALAQLKEYFGARPMSANQARQALLPAGSHMFANKVGTAPGCAVPLESGGYIVLLPGPPSELEAMLEDAVIPFLASLSDASINSWDIRTFGIGEGAAAERIRDLMQSSNPTVAPYAHGGEMFVRVTAKAKDKDAAFALASPVISEIQSRLGDVVYGVNAESLEAAALKALLSQKRTIATAESCTGGLLAKRLTDLPGASGAFLLGVVSYANTAKERILQIPANLLEEFGAVSPQVARSMARNVREIADADFGIGITGIAGPDGATPEKPLGLVFIALASSTQTWAYAMQPQGRYLGRVWVRERASSIALDMLRRALNGLEIRGNK